MSLLEPAGICKAIIGSLVGNYVRKRYRLPLPAPETEPLATALVISYLSYTLGTLPRSRYAASLAGIYSSTASKPAGELLVSLLTARLFSRLFATFKQREIVAMFMLVQPYIIHHWSCHSNTMGTFFRSFLDKHIGFTKAELQEYRVHMESKAQWIPRSVSHPDGNYITFIRTKFALCVKNTAKTLAIISVLSSGMGILKKGLPALKTAVSRLAWNTTFLVCVFQSSVWGPVIWNELVGDKRPPSLSIRSLWWWFVASGLLFEDVSRRKDVAAFMAAQAVIIAAKKANAASLFPVLSVAASLSLQL